MLHRNVIFGCLVVLVLFSIVQALLAVRKNKKKAMTWWLVLMAVFVLLIPSYLLWCDIEPSYDLAMYEEENQYYLGVELTKDGSFTYIVPPDFRLETSQVDFDKAIIAGRMDMIGLDNKYRKYKELGPITVYWDTREDVFILSKYNAIQFGMLEATGAEDEQEFKISTGEEAQRIMEEEMNKQNGVSGEDIKATPSEALNKKENTGN